MADEMQARLARLEWLLDVAIGRLLDAPGPRDQVYIVLKSRLDEQASTALVDAIAALDARAATDHPPTRDEILTAVAAFRGMATYMLPEHFVGEVLEAFTAEKLLSVWRGKPSSATAGMSGSAGGTGK